MIDTLQRMFLYQDWAMEQLWPALDQLTDSELDMPGCSGNGTIRQTLTHLVRAHDGWFRLFDGTMPTAEQQSEWWKGIEFRTMADARAAWREASDRAAGWVAKLGDADIVEIATPERPRSSKPSVPLRDLLLHVAHHGTHTRAQVAAAIRRLGKEPGNIDYLKFAKSMPSAASESTSSTIHRRQ